MSEPIERTQPTPPIRSPRLLSTATSMLLVVDIQDRLLAKIEQQSAIIWNASRLIRGAQILDVPVECSEQYPERLGETVEPLRALVSPRWSKRDFSALCQEGAERFGELAAEGRTQVVICGIETHVCVLQTALDLIAQGFDVYVIADAVGARRTLDHEIALQRMLAEGVAVATTESVLFEWCQTSLAANFKQISQLVQETEA